MLPDTGSITSVQLGIGVNSWTRDLLLRIKHRFGVSAESFLYRLGELELISREAAEGFKARIAEHYKAANFGEPDGSRRILTLNGRLGDLLLLAASMDEHSDEVRAIQKLFKHHGIEVYVDDMRLANVCKIGCAVRPPVSASRARKNSCDYIGSVFYD